MSASSIFPNHLPQLPTFNSSNPFLNSTDNILPSGTSASHRFSELSAGDGRSDSSQPHPLRKTRGTKRNLEEVDAIDTVHTDELPDKTRQDPPGSVAPQRQSAKRSVDLGPKLNVYGYKEETATHPDIDLDEDEDDEADAEGEEFFDEDGLSEKGEEALGDEADIQDGGDTESSNLSSEFDDAPFVHECQDMVVDPQEYTIDDTAGKTLPPEEQILRIPTSDLNDLHMPSRSFDDRLDVKADIQAVHDSIPGLKSNYRIVDRLGEGTFSSVYKAIDLYGYAFDNKFWRRNLHLSHSRNTHTYVPHLGATDGAIPDPDSDADEAWDEDGKPLMHYVALKRIYVTSSPERIENELEIMEALRGCRNTAQLITAFRSDDQVVAVMPFLRGDDFRHYYKHLDPPSIRRYFRCLFRSLNDIHNRGIIHRDVKPANFLWDYESGEGVLVDFGLAERYEPPSKIQCQHSPATLEKPHGERVQTKMTSRVEQAVYDARNKVSTGRVGVPQLDQRPGVRANRAGTRGFRAPEVLLKCPDQTFAIDIWAAGIMLLSIVCHKFPVFNSNDDTEAFLELACLFGKTGMERAAILHNRTMSTNIATVPTQPVSLTDLALSLNPNLYSPPCLNPTPAEAKQHIESTDTMLDLLKRCLNVDATRRWTAGMLLRHRFLEEDLRDDEKELGQEQGGAGEIWPIGGGICGHLHYTRNGQHIAVIKGSEYVCGWGQGRAYGDQLCHLHQEDNQRPTIDEDDIELPR